MEHNMDPSQMKRLYNEYLREISDVKFTLREIEVLSCLLHNRTEKKIAMLLSINPRTVSSHVANMLSKVRSNSRDLIVDFAEKSGKLQYLRQYYFHILVQNLFKSTLEKIGKLVNRGEIKCRFYTKATSNDNVLLASLIEHLKLTNINLVDSVLASKPEDTKFNIYILTEKNEIADIEEHNDQLNNIILLLDNAVASKLPSVKYLDFKHGTDFYYTTFELLKIIIDKDSLKDIIEEFKKGYHALQESWKGGVASILSLETNYNTDFTTKNPTTSKVLIITLSIIMVCSLVALSIVGNAYYVSQKTQDFIGSHQALSRFYDSLSVRNLTKEEAEQNYEIMKQLDETIRIITSDKAELQHGYYTKLKSQELLNTLYNLNAVSSYVLFKEHDEGKAIKLLTYAKGLAESYLHSRSKLPIDFNKLTSAEIYTELSIIQDLPEMYTITLYFLGRSYLYQKNIQSAEKCFQLSRDLGSQLGLFEGFLSVVNGLAIIDMDKATLNIQQGNYLTATKTINACIATYEAMKQDGRSYKKNYRPHNYNPTVIVPNKDIYHLIDCSKRITKLYTKLAQITDDKSELTRFMQEVLKQFGGTDNSSGIMQIFQSNEPLTRILADTYNALGSFLLVLYEKDIDLKEIKNSLVSSISLIKGSDLEAIYQIFDLSKTLSRSTEFSKADAYDGLVKVTKRMLYKVSTEEEKQTLLLKIKEFEEARDIINRTLKRP